MEHLTPDSIFPFAAPFGRGYRNGLLSKRTRAPVAVVVHTTGAGIGKRATHSQFAGWRHKHRVLKGDCLATAVAVYGNVMDASGHYVIDQTGAGVQLVPETHCAWHVGSAKSHPYRGGDGWHKGHSKYAWWRRRWNGFESPDDLAGGELWLGGSCNSNTLSVEIAPHAADPQAEWSDECWRSLARLVVDLFDRYDLPLSRSRVPTHSDAHPLVRTKPNGKPWDPGYSQWNWPRMSKEIAAIVGAPPACYEIVPRTAGEAKLVT